MNPDQPPSTEAVKAAFMFADGNHLNMQQAQPLIPYAISPDKTYAEISARILAAHARAKEADLDNIKKILADPAAVHVNLMRGTIAYTPDILRHVLGDDGREVARLREALETIAANPGNLSDDKCRFASGDIARKALTREDSHLDASRKRIDKALTGEASA